MSLIANLYRIRFSFLPLRPAFFLDLTYELCVCRLMDFKQLHAAVMESRSGPPGCTHVFVLVELIMVYLLPSHQVADML